MVHDGRQRPPLQQLLEGLLSAASDRSSPLYLSFSIDLHFYRLRKNVIETQSVASKRKLLWRAGGGELATSRTFIEGAFGREMKSP